MKGKLRLIKGLHLTETCCDPCLPCHEFLWGPPRLEIRLRIATGPASAAFPGQGTVQRQLRTLPTKQNEAMQCVQLLRSSQLGLSSSEKLRPESAEIPGLIWIILYTNHMNSYINSYDSCSFTMLVECALHFACLLKAHAFNRWYQGWMRLCLRFFLRFFFRITQSNTRPFRFKTTYWLLNFIELCMSKERDLKCSGKALLPDAKALGWGHARHWNNVGLE